MVGVRERQREIQLYRGQIPSPERPTVSSTTAQYTLGSRVGRSALWISAMTSKSIPWRTARADMGRLRQE